MKLHWAGIAAFTCSASALAQGFDPSGTWNVSFTDECVASSRYSDGGPPVSSKVFKCSDYLGYVSDTQLYNQNFTLDISYDAPSNSVTLRGGPVDLPERTVALDGNRFGSPMEPIFSQLLDLSPGCSQLIEVGEVLAFTESNQLDYLVSERSLFLPEPSDPDACEDVLAGLGAAIQNGGAPEVFAAIDKTGAISLSRIQSLQLANISHVFEAQKSG